MLDRARAAWRALPSHFSLEASNDMRDTKRAAAAAMCALVALCATQQAWALDGYQDKRGFFVGAGLGGGVGLLDGEEDQGTTGLDRGRKLGMHLSAIMGSGMTDNLVFGGEVNWWARTVDINDSSLNHNHLSFLALGNFFLFEGLFIEGGAGFAYGAYDSLLSNGEQTQWGEMGLGLKAGAGFEYFMNSQVAIGTRIGYTRHVYSKGDFDTVAGGITVRWY